MGGATVTVEVGAVRQQNGATVEKRMGACSALQKRTGACSVVSRARFG